MRYDFNYLIDPGHGWVCVTVSDAAWAGLKPSDFSKYSPRRGELLYLEEDCDAPKFIAAWERKMGRKVILKERLNDHSLF